MVSAAYHQAVNSNGKALPLTLLEITHPDLATPVRVVNDTQAITVLGNEFTPLSFRPVWPDDLSQGLPRAGLAIDNVGRELTQWIESTAGGQGAEVRLMQVLRSDPDTIELDITLGLDNVELSQLEVTGELGFEDILNRPATTVNYRPEVAPGLF